MSESDKNSKYGQKTRNIYKKQKKYGMVNRKYNE